MYLLRTTSGEEGQPFLCPCQGNPWERKAEAPERVKEASLKKRGESDKLGPENANEDEVSSELLCGGKRELRSIHSGWDALQGWKANDLSPKF